MTPQLFILILADIHERLVPFWVSGVDILKLKVLSIIDKLVWWPTQLKLKIDHRKKTWPRPRLWPRSEPDPEPRVRVGESESNQTFGRGDVCWRKGKLCGYRDRQIDILSHPAWHSRAGESRRCRHRDSSWWQKYCRWQGLVTRHHQIDWKHDAQLAMISLQKVITVIVFL